MRAQSQRWHKHRTCPQHHCGWASLLSCKFLCKASSPGCHLSLHDAVNAILIYSRGSPLYNTGKAPVFPAGWWWLQEWSQAEAREESTCAHPVSHFRWLHHCQGCAGLLAFPPTSHHLYCKRQPWWGVTEVSTGHHKKAKTSSTISWLSPEPVPPHTSLSDFYL